MGILFTTYLYDVSLGYVIELNCDGQVHVHFIAIKYVHVPVHIYTYNYMDRYLKIDLF